MEFETIFQLKDTKLKAALSKELKKFGYETLCNKKQFLYAEGNAPYMLIAHLDTVHDADPSIICYSKDGNYVMSPQGIGGDDRCGVYIIFELLKLLKWRPYIVFTMEEEVGGIGANAFVKYMADKKTPELKYIVEYDRKGKNDCVFYDCDNAEFTKFVEDFGFKEAYGSFSDISVIAPAFGVAAVNISSGYYNPHTQHEYVSISDMEEIIKKSVNMLNAECESFEYIEAVRKYKGSSYYYGNSWLKQYAEPSKYEMSNYYTNINATVLPAGTVLVATVDEYHINTENEIAIDKEGNTYRYNRGFNDYSIAGVELYDISGRNVENMYDESNTTSIKVFGY